MTPVSVAPCAQTSSGIGVPSALGSAHRMNAPYQAIRCADGYITLGAANERLFRRLCDVFGRAEWIGNPAFADNANRVKHREALAAQIEAITITQPRAHWLALLEANDIPCGPINDYAQAFADPQVRARGMVVDVDHPTLGPLRTLGVPEPVIDVFEPFFRVIVEQGYDRSIPAWQPTPARLIPEFDLAQLTSDLVDAVSEGIDNAGALVDPSAPLKPFAPKLSTDSDDVAQVAEMQTNESIGAVQSVDNPDTTEKSQGDRSNNSTPFTTGPTRQTPLRDAAKNLRSGIKKVVNDVSNNIKKSLNTRKRESLKSQHEAEGNQSADSTSTASS